jgi:hypothetical protein
VLRFFAAYLAAAVPGIAAPLLLLHIARSAPAGFDPVVTATAIVCALGVVSGLLAAVASGHWTSLALVASGPTALLGLAMYFALAEAGGRYGVWLFVGLGSLAVSLVTAVLASRIAERLAPRGRSEEERT